MIEFKRVTTSPDNEATVWLWLQEDRYHYVTGDDYLGTPTPVENEPEYVVREEDIDVFVVQWLRGPQGPAGPMGPMGLSGRYT